MTTDNTSSLPAISVILPVHNGRRTLPRCLEALTSGEGEAPEVVVVDDASTDGTADLAAGFPVRLIHLDSNRGPATARNIGAEAATGEILLFIDADVEVQPGTVRTVAEFFRDHPRFDALMGSYDTEPAAPEFFSQYRNLLHHFIHQHAREEAATFWCGCGAVRRSVFLSLGGFRDSFSRPSIEDIEFGARMVSAGHRIRLMKELQVKHLKRWRFLEILRTDFFDRAIPWSLLIISGYRYCGGLNLQKRHRLSAVAVMLTLGSLIGSQFWPWLLAVAVVSGLLFLCLTWGLHRFFHRHRGVWFALRALPMVILYYLYSSTAFAVGTLLYLGGRRLE